jgi:hypothetical protein
MVGSSFEEHGADAEVASILKVYGCDRSWFPVHRGASCMLWPCWPLGHAVRGVPSEGYGQLAICGCASPS